MYHLCACILLLCLCSTTTDGTAGSQSLTAIYTVSIMSFWCQAQYGQSCVRSGLRLMHSNSSSIIMHHNTHGKQSCFLKPNTPSLKRCHDRRNRLLLVLECITCWDCSHTKGGEGTVLLHLKNALTAHLSTAGVQKWPSLLHTETLIHRYHWLQQ